MGIFRKKIFWFLFILLILGFVAWKFILVPNKIIPNTSKQEKTYTVRRDTLKETMTISGELAADDISTARFSASGLLSWIGVKKGDVVKKGQVIATLDKTELKKTLQKDLNTYEQTRRTFEDSKDQHYDTPFWNLDEHHRNEVTRAYESVQFDLNNSVIDVELQNIALQYATLTAPISGVVTTIGAPFAGVQITPAQAAIEIINPDSLYFSLLPDQTEVTKLHASMSAELMFDSYEEEKIIGTITDIAFVPKAGETNTVYEVKIQYDLNDPTHTKYRVGMTGDAVFTTMEKQDILTIPITAVKTEKEKKYVMKKTKDKKEKVYVETGIESDEMVEITGGLAEGDVIYD